MPLIMPFQQWGRGSHDSSGSGKDVSENLSHIGPDRVENPKLACILEGQGSPLKTKESKRLWVHETMAEDAGLRKNLVGTRGNGDLLL